MTFGSSRAFLRVKGTCHVELNVPSAEQGVKAKPSKDWSRIPERRSDAVCLHTPPYAPPTGQVVAWALLRASRLRRFLRPYCFACVRFCGSGTAPNDSRGSFGRAGDAEKEAALVSLVADRVPAARGPPLLCANLFCGFGGRPAVTVSEPHRNHSQMFNEIFMKTH